MTFWTKATLGLATAGTLLAFAAPAEAQRYHRYRDRHDDTDPSRLAELIAKEQHTEHGRRRQLQVEPQRH